MVVIEQQVLELLDLVVAGLDGVEVAINDVIEQSVHERPDSVLDEVGVVVPPAEQSFDGKLVVLSNGDQCVRGDERSDLPRDQLTGLDIEMYRVGGEEVMPGVAGELRTLTAAGGVLDGKGVQP